MREMTKDDLQDMARDAPNRFARRFKEICETPDFREAVKLNIERSMPTKEKEIK